jgi:hypothetical protein
VKVQCFVDVLKIEKIPSCTSPPTRMERASHQVLARAPSRIHVLSHAPSHNSDVIHGITDNFAEKGALDVGNNTQFARFGSETRLMHRKKRHKTIANKTPC